MKFIYWEINWKDTLYYLILPLTILIYYIFVLIGNINDNFLIYDGSVNIVMFLFLIVFFYFSIFRQSRLKRYIIVILTSILIFVIGEISMILYTLLLSNSTHIYIAYGQSELTYALMGFIFINLFNMLLNYKKETLDMKTTITRIFVIGIFIISVLPLIDPYIFFVIIPGIAYQVHIISYFLGIIFGLVLQISLFENNIFLKLKKEVIKNEQ